MFWLFWGRFLISMAGPIFDPAKLDQGGKEEGKEEEEEEGKGGEKKRKEDRQ